MNVCAWTDCSFEVGLFDGLPSNFLNSEARYNIPVDKDRFICLCPEHSLRHTRSRFPTQDRVRPGATLCVGLGPIASRFNLR